MNRPIALILIFFTLLTGCQKELKPSEMNPNDLPDERALQDEFTREFLQSAEETRPGYYPFLSNTGKYKMDFPAGGIIGKNLYNIRSNVFETMLVSILNNDGTGSELSLFYYKENTNDTLNFNLESFKGRLGRDVEFEKIELNEHDIYYAYYEFDKFQDHVAYLQNKKNGGGLEIIYSTYCTNENINLCKKNKKERNKKIYDWVKTINFINEYESVEN